jgi:hypothetical protein
MLRDTAFIARKSCHIARIGFRATKRGDPMPRQIHEKDFAAILAAVARHPGGASRVDIAKALPQKLSPRTLQFRLRSLVEAGCLKPEGESRAVKYHLLAAAIEDSYEQSFFVTAQLPYLQPFDDVNKRVSRLAANIPFIKRNLSPLSFTGVPWKPYNEAMLGIYELNDIALLKDVFLWADGRSAE